MIKKLDNDQLQTLLIKSQNGDQKAYTEFLTTISYFIENRVKFKVFHIDDIQDVVQMILLSIHKSLATYDQTRPALPWVMTIIDRRIIDYIRKITNISENESLSDEIDVTFGAEGTNISVMESLEVFNCLSDDLQKAIKLTKFDGYSTLEAAEILGIKENALRTRVSRAMTLIKNELMNLNSDGEKNG